jgi:hypothetical protein
MIGIKGALFSIQDTGKQTQRHNDYDVYDCIQRHVLLPPFLWDRTTERIIRTYSNRKPILEISCFYFCIHMLPLWQLARARCSRKTGQTARQGYHQAS